MLDINFIRDNRERVAAAAANKSVDVDIDRLLELDGRRRSLLQEVEALRAERNQLNDKLKGGRPDEQLIAAGKDLKSKLADKEEVLAELVKEYEPLLKRVTNVPTEDTPVGHSEDENKVEYEWGDRPEFAFEAKSHWQIGEAKDWIDKERAAKVAGARFVYLKGDLALLSNAMMRFGIDSLTNQETLRSIAAEAGLNVPDKPFTLVLPPLMLREEVYDAMDRLEPRDDRYQIAGSDLWLQGSAEHVLGSMHYDEVLSGSDLPLRYVGYATSFRQEAGTYGKDSEGIKRLHQFDKLEMESLCAPDESLDEHLFMVAIQEYLMRQLQLPYRKLLKCTYDIGKPNARGVDLEVWLPGQAAFCETHTADYMTDYQARRLKTRFRDSDGELKLVHTNDATAFAQRPLIGIIENYQTADGSVVVPEVLRPYMQGKEVI